MGAMFTARPEPPNCTKLHKIQTYLQIKIRNQMSLTSYKKIIIALLLLAFTSQTLATAAMTCELGKIARPESVVMNTNADTMMHAHHHMSEMPAHDMSAMGDMNHSAQPNNTHQQFDCCKTMGHCLPGGCSLATANTATEFLLLDFNSIAVDFYLNNASSPLTSSFYRPPIFC